MQRLINQLTFGTSRGMTKPAEPSMHEQCWYTCKTEVETKHWILNTHAFRKEHMYTILKYLSFSPGEKLILMFSKN